MRTNLNTLIARCATILALAGLTAASAHARVTRIVIDETRAMPAEQSGGVQYERLAGRTFGEIDLTSAWQGDNAGATAVRASASVDGNHGPRVPVARGVGGTPITGEVFGRIVNRSGPASQPLIVQTNPVPYRLLSLDTAQSRLVTRRAEFTRGEVIGETAVASGDWVWAQCDTANPFPGTPNPLAGWVTHSIGRGVSQSGNFLRGWNIAAGAARPFHQDQICNYVGGMIPFARSAQERKSTGDPRLSLEERYGSHEGYVGAVRKAAERAVVEGFCYPTTPVRS